MKRDALGWIRDVTVTAIVVTLGFIALAVVTGHAYATLPVAAPGRPAVNAEYAAPNPHGQEPACAYCHRAHTATDPPLLVAAEGDSSICTRCHDGSGAEAVSSHSNEDFVDRERATTFYNSCTECHDPHGNPETGNRAMIRPVIAGLDVNFTTTSGAGSFDDGMDNGLHDSVCVVCHTTTAHNNVTSPEMRDDGHGPVGTDCTLCHKHGSDPNSRSGFMTTAVPTDTPTATGTPTPTDTPAPPPTDTPTVTDTPTATATDTPTDTPTATATPG